MKKYLIVLLTVFALNSCEQDPEIISVDAEKILPKVEVCHYDADTDTWKTISISEEALKAHLNHGDYKGVCVNVDDQDGDGFTIDQGDCDDNNPDVNPEALEVCPDGIDNDCDGLVDEACDSCDNPVPEICDGLDNDCDGQIDEDWPELGKICIDFDIVDGVTVQVYRWLACNPIDLEGDLICADRPFGFGCDENNITTEIIDGLDNDCDGLIDEGFPLLGTPCSSGVGACQTEDYYVSSPDGTSVVCNAQPGVPSEEICDDGIDNDCDGIVDEGCEAI